MWVGGIWGCDWWVRLRWVVIIIARGGLTQDDHDDGKWGPLVPGWEPMEAVAAGPGKGDGAVGDRWSRSGSWRENVAAGPRVGAGGTSGGAL